MPDETRATAQNPPASEQPTPPAAEDAASAAEPVVAEPADGEPADGDLTPSDLTPSDLTPSDGTVPGEADGPEATGSAAAPASEDLAAEEPVPVADEVAGAPQDVRGAVDEIQLDEIPIEELNDREPDEAEPAVGAAGDLRGRTVEVEDRVEVEERDQLEPVEERDQVEEDTLAEGPETAGDFPTAPLRLGVLSRPATPPHVPPPAPQGALGGAVGDLLTGGGGGLDEDAFAEEVSPEEVLEDGFEDDPLSGELPAAAAPSPVLPVDRPPLARRPPDVAPAGLTPIEQPAPEGEPVHHRHAAPSEADLPAPRAVPGSALSPRMRLLYAMRPRATRAQVLALVLCFVLGLAGFLAVRQNQSLGLASMRQSDLVSLLDNVTEKSNRLEDETRRLQDTADRLKSGSDKSAAALQAAQQRLELLGILAGTSPAVGPGIQLTITDPLHKVTAATILDTVEELRDAGAEAIQIGDVRVVASTAFVDGDNGVRVDGVEVQRPYVLLVIGDAQTLSAALGIPGGVQEVVKQLGGNAKVDLKQDLTVSALRSVSAPQYAHPATSAAP